MLLNFNYMANRKISELTNISTIVGSEVIPVVQTGQSKKGTLQEIAEWALKTFTGFAQSATSAVARSIQSKLRDTISVKDFGAVGDGSTDDTAAIQAAVAAATGTITGFKIYFPVGVYKISATIDIGAKQNMFLIGDGSNTTVIQPTSGVTTVFKFGDLAGTSYQGINDLHIACVNATSCIAITVENVNSFWCNGITITNADIGIQILGGVIQYYTNFQINLSKTAGIKLVGGNDQFFKHGVLSNVGATMPTVAGIWCTKSDAFWIDSVDCIAQKTGCILRLKEQITFRGFLFRIQLLTQGLATAFTLNPQPEH